MTELEQMLHKFLDKKTFEMHFNPKYLTMLYEYVQYICLILRGIYKEVHGKDYLYQYNVNDRYNEPHHVLIFLWSLINGDDGKTFFELPEKERLGKLFFLLKYEQKALLCNHFKPDKNFDPTVFPSGFENII